MRSGCGDRAGGPIVVLLALTACSGEGDPAGAPGPARPPPARSDRTISDRLPTEPRADDALAAELASAPGRIAFVLERGERKEIHLCRPDGGERRLLAADPAADLFPAAASTGDSLLAVRTTGGESDAHRESLIALPLEPAAAPPGQLATAGRIRNPGLAATGDFAIVESDARSVRDLYRVTVPGGELERLTDSRHGNFEPSLSPDGKRIVFVSSRDGNAEIYAMPSGGGAQTRLTAFHRDDWSPIYSPRGDRLAFLSAREGAARVFLMKPDGTGQRRLAADWDAEVEEESPAFSPDGTRLALVARRPGGVAEVWVAEIASGRRWPVSPADARDATPAWSPDGRYLVFASHASGGADLVVARAEGGAAVRITRDPAPEWLPRWLP